MTSLAHENRTISSSDETNMVRRGLADYLVLHMEMLRRLYIGDTMGVINLEVALTPQPLSLVDLGEILEDSANRLLDIADGIRDYVRSARGAAETASQPLLEQTSQKINSVGMPPSIPARTKRSSR